MLFIVVRVWFILECHRGHFPSCWHHAIGRKWGHPKVLAQLEFIGVCLSSEHLGLFWPYLPHLNSESHHFFSWTPYSSGKILSKFHNFSHPARPFPKVSVYAECMGASLNSEHSGLF